MTVNGHSLHVGDEVELGGGVDDSQETRMAIEEHCPTALHDVWDTD